RQWRILQINLNGCRIAQELMHQTAVELGVELVIISEPWKTLPHWHTDPSGKAAVWVTERGVKNNEKIRAVGCKEGAVAVELDEATVISCYFSPNISFSAFEERLEGLQELIMECDRDKTLAMGDFNAKSPAWGSKRGDNRGLATLELAGCCGLTPLLCEGEYSFERNGRYSLIDIALSGKDPLARWVFSKILDTDSASDHYYIVHEFGSKKNKGVSADYRANKKVDLKRFLKIYEQTTKHADPTTINTREDIDAYVDLVGELSEEATAEDKHANNNRRPVWWWNREIADSRKSVVAARRRLQRARATGSGTKIEPRLAAYKALRGDLKRQIIQAKRTAWEKMIDGVGADLWGKPYKWVMGTVK
ncbi:uncharacterized protein LOC144478053, partial [Augochlora pura]